MLNHMGRARGGPRLILEGCFSFLTYQFSFSGRPVRWPCLSCFQLSRPRCAGKCAFPLHDELSLRDQHISARWKKTLNRLGRRLACFC